MTRKERFEAALARARAGEDVPVYEDPRRRLVPAALALLFFVAAVVLASGRTRFDWYLAGGAVAGEAVLLCVLVRMRAVRHDPVVLFDRTGVAYRLGRVTDFVPWSELRAGYAAPAARRFVVLLLPRENSSLSGAVRLPATSEFRAHELLALIRAYGGELSP